MCVLCASTVTATATLTFILVLLECVMNAWQMELQKKAWACANAWCGARACTSALWVCVTTFKMNIMRVVVQDNSFISFYLIFSRSHFTALKSLLTYSPWWLLLLLFSSLSVVFSIHHNFKVSESMRYECVYVVCALCNVHASILHTQFHNFDFISKILSFGGVMDSHPDAVFFSLDDFTVLGPNAFCWCNALYIDILRRKVISYYTSSTNQMIPIPVRFHFLRSCNCNDLSRTLYLSTYLSMFLSLPLYV